MDGGHSGDLASFSVACKCCCDSPVLPAGDRDINAAWHLPDLGFTSDHAQVQTMGEFLGR